MTIRTVTRLGVAAVLAMAFVVGGCGGRQRPPERGSCRAGREWVPPHEENGQWVDGFCRNRDGG